MGLIFVSDSEGNRKVGPLVYIGLVLLVAIPALLLFRNPTALDKIRGKNTATAPEAQPIQRSESDLTARTGMDNISYQEMERKKQIAEEQQSGLRTDDKQTRDQAIQNQYNKKAEEQKKNSAQLNFIDRITSFNKPAATPTPTPVPTTTEEPSGGYMTFAERMAKEKKGTSGNRPGNKQGLAIEFKPGNNTPPSANTKPGDVIRPNTAEVKAGTPANILPMGTFIPCVLEQDVISTDLQAYVWAVVAEDVTFRRQLQIPKGLVRLRGKAAREPVQNLLDIAFDVMVFSDGTELPISGFAYSAFDIRFPDRYRVRGVPGTMVTPPMYVKLQALLYSAALGASDAYIQNYINQNTETQSTFTTVPQINPTTGETTTVLQQSQGQPVNNQIWGTVGLSAGQAALEDMVEEAKKDLEKYRPYVKLQKGTPVFIQTDATVDVSKRQINGFAIAAEADAQKRAIRGGSATSQDPDVFPPGDARYRYDGQPQNASVFGNLGNANRNSAGNGGIQQPNQQAIAAQAAANVAANQQAVQNTPNGASTQQLMQQMQQLLQQSQQPNTTTP